MKLQPPWNSVRVSNTDDQALPLINVAFLLLVFFLMAGTLVLPEPFAVEHLVVRDGEVVESMSKVLAISRDGQLAYRGEQLVPEDLSPLMFADLEGPLPLKVDAQADAQFVIEIMKHLARAGVENVRLVGVRILPP